MFSLQTQIVWTNWKEWLWTVIDLQNSVLNFESNPENIFPGSSHNVSSLKSLCERSALLAEDPSPLLDILLHGMNMVVWNQVKKFCQK